jgi:2-polyprenyl-6-methoxyphenol hydroxylase-like FAD-dependent oxidoreductase
VTTALVIGAGIAGPVAALALRHAGIQATVHEAHPGPATDLGAWLGLQTNGFDALRAVDAEESVRELGCGTPLIRFHNHRGAVLGEIPTGRPLPGGTPGRSMKRSDLHHALQTLARRHDIEIRYGHRLLNARAEGAGVVASFADGSTARADLLLGCDGIHSRVRTLLDPHAPRARYVPMVNTGGYADAVPPGAEPSTLTMWFGRRAFAGYIVTGDAQAWWFANPPRRHEPAGGELAGMTDAGWRCLLHALYGEDPSPVTDLIEATPGPLAGWTMYDLPKVPVWHDDRMVLLGDAAHAVSPSTGQGASMAIEDAVVLAQCLRDLPPAAAFARFETIRRPRVERVVAEGVRSSRLRSAGPVTRLVRNLVLPLVLQRAAGSGDDSLAWMHRHHIEWNATPDAPARRSTG